MYKDVVFNFPFLWEGVHEATVKRLFVKQGDFITPLSPSMEVETDEATVEIPIGLEGKVVDLYIKPGDKLIVGSPVCSVNSFQTPSSEELQKFYLEITALLGLTSASSFKAIRDEIEKIISKTNV